MVALNAGAAVYVSGLAQTHRAGVEQALAAIRSGRAVEKMRQLAAFSQQLRKQSHA
jgi:anthranilate phosphoribosyltransferase